MARNSHLAERLEQATFLDRVDCKHLSNDTTQKLNKFLA